MIIAWWIVLAALGALLGVAFLVMFYWSILESMYPEAVRSKEVHTVTTRDLWKLRMCRFRKGRTEGEPVLLVHGALANHHNFTAPEGHSLVDFLAAKGYDCWAIDLRGCKSSEPPFERAKTDVSFDDYLLYDLPAAIRYIRKTTGYDKVHWVGHSMGGMLLYAYSLQHGNEHIASGTTLGSPVGFDGVRVRLHDELLFMVKSWPAFCGKCIRGLIPIAMLCRFTLGFFPTNMRNLHPSVNSGHFYSAIDEPLHKVLSELAFSVRKRVWRVNKDALDVKAGLATLEVPLLAVYGPRDPFVPVDEAKKFFDALPTADKKMLVASKEAGCEEDYSHIDLAFGRDSTRMIYGPIAKWFEAHPIVARVNLDTIATEDDDAVLPALGQDRRAEILSGDSFARITEQAPARAEAPAPAAAPAKKKTAAKTPAKKKTAAKKKPAAKTKPTAKKAPARPNTLAKKKAAAKRKTAAAATETGSSPKKKATAKKATSKKTTAAKKKPAAKKPAAKKPTATKKAATKKTTAKPKATTKKKAAPKKTTAAKKKTTAKKKAEAIDKSKPSDATRSALANASAALDKLK